jgi:hypothetical protein
MARVFLEHAKSTSLQPTIKLRYEIAVVASEERWLLFGGRSAAHASGNRDWSDEAITSPGYRLYEAWSFRIVFQCQAQFPDGPTDAIVRVQENSLAPNPGNDLISTDNFAAVFDEEEKDF